MAKSSRGGLLKEARRRQIFRLSGIYIVSAWVLVQIALAAFPAFDIPESAIRFVWLGVVLGFPVALVLGWRYDITGGRIVRTVATDDSADLSINRSDYLVLAALFIAATFAVISLVSGIVETRAPETNAPMPAAVARNTIAVLPFVNMSDDPANEYLADGLSEEILNLLARVRDLQVTSRSSAFSFKGQNADIPTIGRKLNVAHVLEGSVRRAGDQLRITAQLIDVENDVHLWSETYDRKIDNIFEIQDGVAAAVADALKVTLLSGEGKATETNPEAYTLYLRGQYMSDYDLDESERLYRQSVSIDPGYAPAWLELGWVLVARSRAELGSHEENIPEAREAAEKALEIDPHHANAYHLLAYIEYNFTWDFDAAREYMQQAMRFDPGNENVYRQAADIEIMLGNYEKAEEHLRERLAIDPLKGHQYMGRVLTYQGRFDEAEQHFREQLILTPNGIFNYLHLVFLELARGDAEAAQEDLSHFPEGNVFHPFLTALVRHSLGDEAASDAAFNLFLEKTDGQAAYQVAGMCAWRGDADCAFEWLNRAYEFRDDGLKHIVSDVSLTPIHDDPRWDEFLARIGIPADASLIETDN